MTNQWPVTDLDAVQRMRVLASALPGGGFARLHIDAPVERVWAYIADLERSIPELIGFIRRFELLGDGTAVARGPVRNRGRFDVELRDGWCVMQDRFVVGGFAAAADGDGTLLAVCGAVRTPGLRRIVPLVLGRRTLVGVLERVRRATA
jgi:hypothetical protein